ncbi:LPXTG cell wall anchor domain-containing protein [Erwinia sp. CPCC 100877]|nr:LPXTG cell wall anchor domain-containing protein [Erwinia sp. CPCC 100877]
MKYNNLKRIYKNKAFCALTVSSLFVPLLFSQSFVWAQDTDSTATVDTAAVETSSNEATTETTSTTLTTEATEQTAQQSLPAETQTSETEETAVSSVFSEATESSAAPRAFASDSVTILDPALKNAILAQLNLPADSKLTKADMEQLTILQLTDTAITSLSGLEYATNLATFSINGNLIIDDFSPLEQLTSLDYVTLQTPSLNSANFPDLSKSTQIVNLHLASTDIDNTVFEKIVKLKELDRLYLDSNMKITTIEPLNVLPKLTSLSVQFCGVTDFTCISTFPVLNYLSATGQNTGRQDPATKVGRLSLDYDAQNQTLFLPFSMMPNRLTNFDGYVLPFTTSNSASQTYLDFNDVRLPVNRLAITDDGITVLDVTEEEYYSINTIEYNARYNAPAGSYATPANYNFYAISSGTYLHKFIVTGQPVTIKYLDTAGNPLIPKENLTGMVGESFDVPAKTIPGYKLKETIGATSGTFTNTDQEVTFVYVEDTQPSSSTSDSSGSSNPDSSTSSSSNSSNSSSSTSSSSSAAALTPTTSSSDSGSANESLTNSNNHAGDPAGKTAESLSTKKLPTTGETSQNILVALGLTLIGLLSVSAVFRKKYVK